jgi:hypothetical protein
MTYWIAINAYRSDTDHGGANTWAAYVCADRSTQRHLLNEGLPTYDSKWPTTMGIRALYPDEYRRARREIHIEEVSLAKDGRAVYTLV